MEWNVRLAREEDISALESLIPVSVRELQAAYYSPAQMTGALGSVFGVDRQLILDGTFFVVEENQKIAGCGGWSRRRSHYGADCGRKDEDPLINPETEPARIRAFFVHPAFARRGIGRHIMQACESAIRAAGFRMAGIVATLAGEPLFAAFGYEAVERYEIVLSNGLGLPVVRMTKRFET